MDELKKDARFAHIPKDPRFRPASKTERKLKIDRRFSSMFKDPKFKLKYTVDKRGRPLLEERTTRDDMKKFYHLDDEEQSSSTSEDDEEIKNTKKKTIVTGDEQLDEILQSDDTDEEDEQDQETSGDDDEEEGEQEGKDDQSSSSEDEDIPEVDDGIDWNEFDEKCVRSEDMSRRLAVCNMDWDRVRAADVFVLLNSWKPADGVIKSVTIYPSEYGLKQMAIEKQHGPLPGTAEPVESDAQNGNDSGHQSDAEEEPELPEVKSDDEEELNLQNFNEQDDPDVTDPVMRERIRKYQLNRLKYYYAVVECDTVETAAKIYGECDGLEYETSAVRLDLRFIPDSTSFDESVVHDRCTELPEKSAYKPILFRNTALTQTKVRCTWDETPLDRRLLMRKKFTVEEIEKLDLDAYLASESEDESNDDDNENDITSDIEDDEEAKAENNDKDGIFKVPAIPGEKKSTKSRPVMKAPSVLSSQDDIERYRALLLGFDDDSDSKSKKKTKKKITNFFDDERASDEDDDDRMPQKTQADDDDDDDDPSDVDMEITWQPGLKSKDDDKVNKQSEKKNKNKKDKKSSKDVEQDDDEDDVDQSDSDEKPNQDSLALLTVDDDNETKRDYNLRQMIKAHKQAAKAEAKKKKKSKKSQGNFVDSISEKTSEDQFQLNVDDQRFSAVYNQAAFNIDQSDPHFKATAGTQRIIEEKLKKRKFDQTNSSSTVQTEQDDLVAKLKRKSAKKY